MSARVDLFSISFSRASRVGSAVERRMIDGSHRQELKVLHTLEVSLEGNQLTGCIPSTLHNLTFNKHWRDRSRLGLPNCE